MKFSYPDLLQVVEVVSHPDGDLARRVALVRFIVGVDAQHLHRGPPPERKRRNHQRPETQPVKPPSDPSTLPELDVDQVRLRAVRLPVRLQVVVPQLVHAEAWTETETETETETQRQSQNTLTIFIWILVRSLVSDPVYRRTATTPPASRSPGPSPSAPAALGRRRGASCSGWPSCEAQTQVHLSSRATWHQTPFKLLTF